MTSSERRQAALRAYGSGETAEKVAKRYKVSPQTIYNWAKAARDANGNGSVLEAVRETHSLVEQNQRLIAENAQLTERLQLTTRLLSSYIGS